MLLKVLVDAVAASRPVGVPEKRDLPRRAELFAGVQNYEADSASKFRANRVIEWPCVVLLVLSHPWVSAGIPWETKQVEFERKVGCWEAGC